MPPAQPRTLLCERPGIARQPRPDITSRRLSLFELTIKADSKLIQKMKILSKKRNATSYDSAGNVSKQELELAIKTAAELQRKVVAWMEKNHPDLLESQK